METLFIAVAIFTVLWIGTYSLYWYLIRPTLLMRFRFVLAAERDRLTAAAPAADAQGRTIVLDRIDTALRVLPQISLCEVLIAPGPAPELRAELDRENAILEQGGQTCRDAQQRISYTLLGACMANSPVAFIGTIILLGLTFWFGWARVIVARTIEDIWGRAYGEPPKKQRAWA